MCSIRSRRVYELAARRTLANDSPQCRFLVFPPHLGLSSGSINSPPNRPRNFSASSRVPKHHTFHHTSSRKNAWPRGAGDRSLQNSRAAACALPTVTLSRKAIWYGHPASICLEVVSPLRPTITHGWEKESSSSISTVYNWLSTIECNKIFDILRITEIFWVYFDRKILRFIFIFTWKFLIRPILMPIFLDGWFE